MSQLIRDVMTKQPKTLPPTATVSQAAKQMRDDGIGDIIVADDTNICGIVTDRDITVRAVAEGLDPNATRLDAICSRELTQLSPRDGVEKAVQLMRDRAIRRIPVVEEGKPVGIVSLGDLAQARDPKSVLGEVSAAPPNM